MVDVTWAHWGVTPSTSDEPDEQQSWFRHKVFLQSLLRSESNPSKAIERGEPGAGISLGRRFPREQAVDEEIDRLGDGASSDDIQWPYEWYKNEIEEKRELRKFSDTDTFFKADRAGTIVKFIADGLEQCELSANRADLREQSGLLASQMNLFACRIYLTPERANELAYGVSGGGLVLPGHTIIDLRFREHLGRYWLYATLSVWTHRPPSLSVYPQDAFDDSEDTVVEPPPGTSLEALWDRYAEALRRGFQYYVHHFFPAAQMKILDREYQPPRFWIVERRAHAAGQHDLLDTLLYVAQTGTTGLAVGDIDARAGRCRARMFRRFIPNSQGTHDRPVHLVLPPYSRSAIDLKHLWSVIRPLSDLEGDAATKLFDIVTDIDMYESQLTLYEKVAAQGSALWDQVALFLPVARGHQLSRVHRIIELIHLVLLQGIADLEEEAANAQHAIERIDAAAYDLANQFDQDFTEVPVADRATLRNSLVEAGYFNKARRYARSVYEKSLQVRATYKALLDGTTYAFDERRVRETDVLQSIGLAFALVLGVVSIWNEFLARSINDWRTDWWVTLGGIGIVGVAVAIWFMRRVFSHLTSNEFKKRFEGELQKLLTDYSSDRLDRRRAADRGNALKELDKDEKESRARGKIFTDGHDKILKEHKEKWRELDETLATKTAEFLDSLKSAGYDTSKYDGWGEETGDIEELHDRVQVWALRALLVTERPRRFCRSPLPRLTFLYRFFPILSGKPEPGPDWSAADSQVSDSDFMFTVINQCGGDPGRVLELNKWGHRQIRNCDGSAVKFVEKLEKVGLQGRMTRKEFYDMMSEVNKLEMHT